MPRMGWQLYRGISGSFRLESVAGLLWNQWQLSCGTGGSFAVESVAGFTWNRWQLCRGIRSQLGAEFLYFNGQPANDNAGVVIGYDGLTGPPPRVRTELYELWWRQ